MMALSGKFNRFDGDNGSILSFFLHLHGILHRMSHYLLLISSLVYCLSNVCTIPINPSPYISFRYATAMSPSVTYFPSDTAGNSQ